MKIYKPKAIRLVIAAPVLLTALAEAGTEAESPISPIEEDSRSWYGLWPTATKEAIKRGHNLPLPFGISFNYLTMTRDIGVTSVRAGFNGRMNDLSDFVSVDTVVDVTNEIGRLDANIFPFLNVYVMAGSFKNESSVDMLLSVPNRSGGTTDVELKGSPSFDSTVYGGGLILSGGWKKFFGSYDVNFASTELGGAFDGRIETFIHSVRIGYRDEFAGGTAAVWLGASYWDTARTTKGSMTMPEGKNTLSFEIDQEPVNPETYSLGAMYEFNQHWQTQAEYRFNFKDAHIFMGGLSYRF